MTQADAVAFLTDTRDMLVSQSDLSPDNQKVNACLSRLVATLQAWQMAGFGEDLADDPDLADVACDLPALCGRAECEMEKWWCRRILASECPGAQALAAFWYLDSYEALCQTELELLSTKQGAGSFAFLGSGALPVTAILLARQSPDTAVTCVDCDSEACELAERLFRVLGLARQAEVKECDAEKYEAQPNKTVICASLLQAPHIFERLHACRTRRVILRDAEGLYRFCYRPAQLPEGGYIERAKSAPSPKRINTSRYFELCETPR